jgi:hypothetical protein
VNPLELARAYATLAYGGRRVDGAMFGNKPRVIEKVTRRAAQRFNAPTKFDALTATEAGVINSIPAEGRPASAPASAPLSSIASVPGRPARPRTTATRGSSATRRSSSSPCGRLPDDAEADADRVPRGCGHGRELPGPDLEDLRRERAQGRAAGGLPLSEHSYVAPKLVVQRGDRLLLDNGLCRTRKEVIYFAGKGPTRKANCLRNEVEVPDVRKLTLAEAEARVAAQPLTAELVYKPATPLQKPGIVVDQQPRRGYRSSYDRIILVVTKATQGVIPNLVGRDSPMRGCG